MSSQGSQRDTQPEPPPQPRAQSVSQGGHRHPEEPQSILPRVLSPSSFPREDVSCPIQFMEGSARWPWSSRAVPLSLR